MPGDESEKKGRVYEAFVKLAFEKFYKESILWEPDIPSVIANQDLVYPTAEQPEIVFAVTYWGSHESANKKFWRTMEDRFEVYCAFPRAKFVSIVFEKNRGSDDALDDVLRNACSGRVLSERYSRAVILLQSYVETGEKVKSFGSGKREVYLSCKNLYGVNEDFRSLIDKLGSEIAAVLDADTSPYCQYIPFFERELGSYVSRKGRLCFSGIRNTYYKMGLVRLLRFAPEEIACVLGAVGKGDWSKIAGELKERLARAGLIRMNNVANRIAVSDELKSIAELGAEGYLTLARQIGHLLEAGDGITDFGSYRDHYYDITDSSRRKSLFQCFSQIRDSEDIRKVLHGFGDWKTERIWIVDYYLALKRVLLKGQYGFRKLSEQLDLAYIGGISPLPSFVSGNPHGISEEKQEELFERIAADIPSFDFEKLNDEIIVHDRTTTLMKKFNIIELLIVNALLEGKIDSSNIYPKYRVRNPLAAGTGNPLAGSTEFNFVVSNGRRSAMIFVVSAYDTSHKHKEVSARSRILHFSEDVPAKDYITVLVMDGTLLKGAPGKKIRMMYEAGWDYAFYPDELETMAEVIRSYLNAKKDR